MHPNLSLLSIAIPIYWKWLQMCFSLSQLCVFAQAYLCPERPFLDCPLWGFLVLLQVSGKCDPPPPWRSFPSPGSAAVLFSLSCPRPSLPFYRCTESHWYNHIIFPSLSPIHLGRLNSSLCSQGSARYLALHVGWSKATVYAPFWKWSSFWWSHSSQMLYCSSINVKAF